MDTLIFDLDGTLYDDERVYAYYAHALAESLPPAERERYLAEWTIVRAGRSVMRVGMGYDLKRDRLFRYAGGRIVSYVDWDGEEEPAPNEPAEDPMAEPKEPPVEVPVFGPERVNIGDLWGLTDVLAARYGVPREKRAEAFLATRDFMLSGRIRLRLEPGLDDLLAALHEAGKHLIAMSNSPADSVGPVLELLGIRRHFARVIPDARKPRGTVELLASIASPERVLSIGDNYVNDIEPALHVGGRALYIDRYATGLGREQDRCWSVPSIATAIEWIGRAVTAGPPEGNAGPSAAAEGLAGPESR